MNTPRELKNSEVFVFPGLNLPIAFMQYMFFLDNGTSHRTQCIHMAEIMMPQLSDESRFQAFETPAPAEAYRGLSVVI